MAVRQLVDDATSGVRSVARRCVIAAQPKTNLEVVRTLLAERGIEATATYERPWMGARPIDTVMAMIDSADLVIAVLDDPGSSTNLGFELGYAFARDKKIMVLLPPDSRSVPSDLAWTHHIRANPSDTEGIAFNLDALLAAPEPKRRPYIPERPETYPIGDGADALLDRLSEALQERDPAAVEQIVADALHAGGVTRISVVAEQGPDDSGFDFGIWSDDLESSVGNPLPITVKLQISAWREVKLLVERMTSLTKTRSVDWALLLYGDGPALWDPTLEAQPPVLVYGIRDLVERLRDESFATVISSLRDQAIRAG
jgi:hypothetical protein